MIVRGSEFWGLDLIVSMSVAYVVVLVLALAIAAGRRGLRRRETIVASRASTRRRRGLEAES